MKKPLLVKYVLPFFQWYALMILIAIAIDYLFHQLDLVWIGRYLGVLGWLAILMLLITVASGLVGKFLLKKANESLKERKQHWITIGMSNEEVEKNTFDSITVDLMKKWRVVHLPITLILGILSLMHIVTVIMFGK
ncbi:MAG: hypothetical protein IPN88_02480 [Bacteroidetes bacterium]|nr:hypothetical protein [Bacteroidota bacterium]